MSVVKNGLTGRESLPEELQREVKTMETNIKNNMTGCDYREYLRGAEWEFEIYWEQGSWGLHLRLLTSEGWHEF